MLASSRVPDVDVYAEVAALKRSHVYRSELSSLDVNETTIPLIQVLKRPTTSSGAGQYGGGYRERGSMSYYGSLEL